MVKTGIDVLIDGRARPLRGQKVGLVTNPTGVLADGVSSIEALRAAGVEVRALFGPEHGVRGDVPAGKYVASYPDAKTGLPVYSLYGKTRTPTPAMLKGLDVLLFDLQDIGSRSYTYLSTLGAVLDGAAKSGVKVMVLDRPNPCGGLRVEGGPVRAGFFSFVSKYPTAYLHGLTLGEAATMMVGEGWIGKPTLEVVKCAGLTREMVWPDFGRARWIPTSPNVPKWQTALLYAATGILGELESVSIGIGVPGSQFALCGAPGVDGPRLADALNARNLRGWGFAPEIWTPTKGAHAGKTCSGVRLILTDLKRAELTRLNFELLAQLRSQCAAELSAGGETRRMFDLSCGADAVRKKFRAGASSDELWTTFQSGASGFASRRAKYLLYP